MFSSLHKLFIRFTDRQGFLYFVTMVALYKYKGKQ